MFGAVVVLSNVEGIRVVRGWKMGIGSASVEGLAHI